tara:strand:+ start:755 stop:1039 length:285 start_codon:yes stop_codon:yes gene_type:complete
MPESKEDNIYISCNPITEYGGEEIKEDEENEIDKSRKISQDMLDDIGLNFSTGVITDNIGFQTLLGLILLGILYGLGNYVFKELPKNLIEKKLR